VQAQTDPLLWLGLLSEGLVLTPLLILLADDARKALRRA